MLVAVAYVNSHSLGETPSLVPFDQLKSPAYIGTRERHLSNPLTSWTVSVTDFWSYLLQSWGTQKWQQLCSMGVFFLPCQLQVLATAQIWYKLVPAIIPSLFSTLTGAAASLVNETVSLGLSAAVQCEVDEGETKMSASWKIRTGLCSLSFWYVMPLQPATVFFPPTDILSF
jgi:hypothetical protein